MQRSQPCTQRRRASEKKSIERVWCDCVCVSARTATRARVLSDLSHEFLISLTRTEVPRLRPEQLVPRFHSSSESTSMVAVISAGILPICTAFTAAPLLHTQPLPHLPSMPSMSPHTTHHPQTVRRRLTASPQMMDAIAAVGSVVGTAVGFV